MQQQRSNNYSRVISQLQQWDDEKWSISELELLRTLVAKKIEDLSSASSSFFQPLFEPDSFLTSASATPAPQLGVWGAKNLKEIISSPPATPSIPTPTAAPPTSSSLVPVANAANAANAANEDYFLNPPTMKACGDPKCPCVYYIQGEDDEVVSGKVKINPKEIFIAGISIETAESPDERLAAHNELRALLKNTPCRIYQPTGKQYAFFSFKSHREAVRAQLLFSRSTFRNNPLYVSFAHFEQHHEIQRPSDHTTKTYLTSQSYSK